MTLDEARESLRATVLDCSSAQETVDAIASYGQRHGATADVTVVVIRRATP